MRLLQDAIDGCKKHRASGFIPALFMMISTIFLFMASPALAQTAPGNDSCANPMEITLNNFSDTQTTGYANGDEATTCSGYASEQGIWYKFTPTQNGTITMDTEGSNFPAVLAAFTSPDQDPCISVVSNACSYDEYGQAYVTFSATANTTYYFLLTVTNIYSDAGNVSNFNFTFTPDAPSTHTVTASAGTGGTISPSPTVEVSHNTSQVFTLGLDPGYEVDVIGGTCGGSMTGPLQYTTYVITAPCTVTASFKTTSIPVTATTGTGGTISPTSVNVPYSTAQVFTLDVDPGYEVDIVDGTCGGSMTGPLQYTTNIITAPCTVNATFKAASYLVTASAGSNGSISPTSVMVAHNNTTVFTVTADSGYEIDTVYGCGAGSLVGATYTTGPITAPCTVNATFKPLSAAPLPLLVVWQDRMFGNNNEIYVRHYNDTSSIWDPLYRLTINTLESVSPRVAVSGSNAYVVWQDNMYGNNNEIYFRRSTNGGVSFEPIFRVSVNSMESVNPDVAAEGNNVYVVWQDTMYGNNNEIYFRRSTNGGVSFEPIFRVSVNVMESVKPRVAASGNNVYVVWQDTMYGNNNEIYYRRSTNGGATFEPTLRLSVNVMESTNPDIAAYGNDVYVVWQDTMYGNNNEIYFRRSTNGGVSFEPLFRVSVNAMESVRPRVAASGNNVYVVWQDNMYGNNNEIYYRRSTNEGAAFEPTLRLSVNVMESINPDITAVGNEVYVVWQDTMYGANNEIYSRHSITEGASFEPIYRLSVHIEESVNPALP